MQAHQNAGQAHRQATPNDVLRGGHGSPVPPLTTVRDFFSGVPTRGRALFEMTVKNILYDRKTIIFFALTILLLIIPGYWAYTADGNSINGLDLFVVISMLIYIQFIVLYASLLFGASLFGEEEDQRTMTYLISRPLSNVEIVVYKYLGFVAAVSVMLVIPLLINFGIIATRVPFEETSGFMFEVGQFIGLMFVAVAAWGAFFMFLGIFIKRFALMVGLIYTLFWETLIANIPAAIRYGTINHYIRSIAPIYVAFGDDLTGLASTSWGWALTTLVIFGLVFIIMTYFVLRNKDYH